MFSPRTLEEAKDFARAAHKSGLFPQLTSAEAAFVLMCIGGELGLSPMQSIRGIHLVDGKTSLSADAMVALVLARGAAEYFDLVSSTPERVEYATKRKGAPGEVRLAWTIEQARKAGLAARKTWQAYPEAMLGARCRSALARAVYPDILMGVYDRDEIEAPRESQALESHAVEVLPATPSRALAAYQAAPALEDGTQRAALEAALTSAESLADLARAAASVAASVKAGALSQHEREALQAVYRLRKEELDVRAITETAAPVMEVFQGAEVVNG